MKKENGITLITLIIYMIVMCIVISILASISNFFFRNTNIIKEDSKYISEYNKFNMYFLDDIKNNENTLEVKNDEIIFEDGTTYTFKKGPDNSIYRNKAKICNNIEYCYFDEKTHNSKKIIQVDMVVKGSKIFETNNEYVLKYW